MPLRFDNRYARLPDRFYARVTPTPVSAPRWLAVNEDLAARLGLSPSELRSDAMLAALAGNAVLEGAEPIAMAYAGHQFGGFSPRLGDGRARGGAHARGEPGVHPAQPPRGGRHRGCDGRGPRALRAPPRGARGLIAG